MRTKRMKVKEEGRKKGNKAEQVSHGDDADHHRWIIMLEGKWE